MMISRLNADEVLGDFHRRQERSSIIVVIDKNRRTTDRSAKIHMLVHCTNFLCCKFLLRGKACLAEIKNKILERECCFIQPQLKSPQASLLRFKASRLPIHFSFLLALFIPKSLPTAALQQQYTSSLHQFEV
jgi:hypothetical protein